MSLKSMFSQIFEPEYAAPLSADVYTVPKPRLATVRRAPGRDEYSAWRDDPTTEFVMTALQRNADEHKELWLAESWSTGEADQARLTALRERADALRGIAEADYEGFCQTLGLEPEGD